MSKDCFVAAEECSGVFRMCERGLEGLGTSSSGVQGQSPGKGMGILSPEAEVFC